MIWSFFPYPIKQLDHQRHIEDEVKTAEEREKVSDEVEDVYVLKKKWPKTEFHY